MKRKKYAMMIDRNVLFFEEMRNILFFKGMRYVLFFKAVTYLNHKSFDDAMEDHIVVISVPR